MSIIDAATHSLIRRIDVPGAVHHVAVNPDSSVAAVTHPNTGAITAIDLETSKVIRTVETGAMPNYAAFSLEGDRLYVSNSGDNSISSRFSIPAPGP